MLHSCVSVVGAAPQELTALSNHKVLASSSLVHHMCYCWHESFRSCNASRAWETCSLLTTARTSALKMLQSLIHAWQTSRLLLSDSVEKPCWQQELTSFLPVLISSSVIGRRHCWGMLNLSRSDGLTPSHLMSGVVRLELSYDMFMEPAEHTSQQDQ